MPTPYSRSLQDDGIVVIPDLLDPDTLHAMQTAFAARLRRLRWNDFDESEKTEPYRLMVRDVLTLEQGYLDLALHPVVKETLRGYMGDGFALVEAKGWLSMPTDKDRNGWHGDAWYDQDRVREVPREVKLAFYLSDVRSGGFQYIRGSHGMQAPRTVRSHELQAVPASLIVEVNGPAGTAILFDTSGIHRQSVPNLEQRHAVVYNYHDPRVPLQQEDVDDYRYHPLLLSAAFLGGLTEEDQLILGFGDKTNFIPAFEHRPKHTRFQSVMRLVHGAAFARPTACSNASARGSCDSAPAAKPLPRDQTQYR